MQRRAWWGYTRKGPKVYTSRAWLTRPRVVRALRLRAWTWLDEDYPASGWGSDGRFAVVRRVLRLSMLKTRALSREHLRDERPVWPSRARRSQAVSHDDEPNHVSYCQHLRGRRGGCGKSTSTLASRNESVLGGGRRWLAVVAVRTGLAVPGVWAQTGSTSEPPRLLIVA